MWAVLRRVWGWLRPRLPDYQDFHLYGGITAVAYGVAGVTGEPGAGWVVAGAALFYLGLRPSRVALRHLEIKSRPEREAV